MSVSKLQQVGLKVGGTTAYATASTTFTRGLLVRTFDVNPTDGAAPVSEVRSKFGPNRVGLPMIDFDAAITFPLDVGDNASGNIGDFLNGVFGTDAVSGTGPYLHTFSRNDTALPKYLNLYSDKDIDNKQYTGFRTEQVKFTIDAGSPEIGVEISGVFKDESEYAGAQTLTYSGSPLLLPSQATTLTLAGNAVTTFSKIEITVKRTLERFHAVGSSRRISNAYSKDFSIDIACEGLDFTAETERDKFIAGTSTAFNLILTDSNANYLRFNLPTVYYQSWKGPDINDSELLKVNLVGFATGDSYNAYLQNMRATGYDAEV
ncbi:MAG: phage tail tube protein [Patescibacteria group bacterium]|jgi:hypothetical protein